MKFGRGIVLAHYPGVGDADFFDGIFRERDHLRIPLADGGVAAFDAGFELRENVLDFAGVGTVGESFGDLRVGDGPAEPGGVPEQERHDDEGEREHDDGEGPASAERFRGLAEASQWSERRLELTEFICCCDRAGLGAEIHLVVGSAGGDGAAAAGFGAGAA